MNILVTGCAGFIGSRTCDLLLDRGNKVIGIDNLNDYYDKKLKVARLMELLDKRFFIFYEKDISEKEPLATIFESFKIDAVINLAAMAGVRASLENPWGFVDTNITGTLNLLELCVKNDIKKFIIASSSSVYGGTQDVASCESDMTDHPLSQYGATKKAAEVLCYSYHYLYGIDVTALRYFTVYGEAGRPDMSIYRFIEGIKDGREIEVYGDGKQKRDFTYVGDIAEGTVKALKPLGYEIINLGNSNPVELLYVIHLIERNLSKEAKIKYLPRDRADVLMNCASIDKAKSLIDWEPKVRIEEGIKKTVRWHLEQG